MGLLRGWFFWTGWPLVTGEKDSWCQAASGACVGQQRRYERVKASTAWPDPLRYGVKKDFKVLRFVDWDGDQDTDVLILRMSLDQQLRLYFYEKVRAFNANDYFTEHFFGQIDISHGPASIDVGDWNDDGHLDLLVCTSIGPNLTIGWLNPSALPRDHHQLTPEDGEVILHAEGSSCEMHAVDFDEDGDLDLILGEFSGAVINRSLPVPRYFERVSGELVERTGIQNPLNPFGGLIYAIADVDGDGRLDVVLKGAEVCRYPFYMSYCMTDFRYFEHAADGSFVEPLDNPFQHLQLMQTIYDDMTEEEKYNDYYIADWNGDGLPDIMEVGYRWDWNVRQQGADPGLAYSPRLSRYEDIHFPRQFGNLKLADFNGDGILDVLFDDELSVILYESHGSGFREVLGAFENVTSVQSHSKLFRVAMSDWDADGDVDLLVATQDGKLHYHEMIHGSWYPEAQHPFSNITFTTHGGRPPHLILVDWNFDGKMDLVLGCQDGRIFEQQGDGSLRQRPESPFARWVGQSADIQEQWRFLDCNGDSALDMLRLEGEEYTANKRLQVCLQNDQGFECGTDLECLGTNFKSLPREMTVRNLGSITAFDVENVTDGLKLVTSHQNTKHLLLWTEGYCEPQKPCNMGSCVPGQVECSCMAGYDLIDCSGCEPFFHSTPAELGQLHGCKACPGANGQVCHGRGQCFDDAVAKALPQTSTAALMARGNGSCLCNEGGFFGWDENGRSTCMDGHCPAGTEEVAGTCRPCAGGSWASAGGLCKKCGPGKFSVEASANCSSCPAGSISAAGASACVLCPAGKYEKDFLTCVDCSPGFISFTGQVSCTKCGAGAHASRAGSTSCELCEAGSFATEGSAVCRPCPAGTISVAGSGMCSPCDAGTISAASGSSACEVCPAGTFSRNGTTTCRVCPAGTVSGAASALCNECAAGYVAERSVSCEACPGGTFAANYKCHPCPSGQVSLPSSVSCKPCAGILLRYTPNDAKEECHVELGEIALALALWISSALLILFLLTGVFGGLSISDLSAQGQSFVVTTSRAHMLLKRAEPIVKFSQTGLPHLEASAWRVRRLSRYQLTLCCDQEDLPPLETSMGFLHLTFPRAFVFTGPCHCPVVCWCFLFLAAVIAIVSQLTWALASAVCGVGICTSSLWFVFQRRQGFQFWFQVSLSRTVFISFQHSWIRSVHAQMFCCFFKCPPRIWPQNFKWCWKACWGNLQQLGMFLPWRPGKTPLAKRRRQFLKEWSLPRKTCSRGPDRSLTAGKLHDFLQFLVIAVCWAVRRSEKCENTEVQVGPSV